MTELKLLPLDVGRDLHHVLGWVNDPAVMGYFAGHEDRIGELDERRYLEKLVQSGNDMVFSAYAGDLYVGQVSINQIHWPSDIGRLFICVTASQQHKGHGRLMLAGVAELAQRAGLEKLWLMVRADNLRSQAMYLRAGFAFEGVLRAEYKAHGKRYDMVRMGKLLST